MGDDFNPASYEGKPRHLSNQHRALLQPFWEAMLARLDEMASADLEDFIAACRNVSPINCAWHDYEIADMLYHTAMAIRDRDGGSAGDAEGGSTAKQRQPGPCAATASP